MPDIAKTTHAEIMRAFRARILEKVPGFDQQNVYVDDGAMPPSAMPLQKCIAITPGPSQFPQADQDSGSVCKIAEAGSIHVTVWQSLSTDEPHRLSQIILDDREHSLLTHLKPKIMRALLVEETASGKQRWMPANERGEWLCRKPCNILSASNPQRWEQNPLVFMTLQFQTEFTWSL